MKPGRRGTGTGPRRLRARNPLWVKAPLVLFRFPGLLTVPHLDRVVHISDGRLEQPASA